MNWPVSTSMRLTRVVAVAAAAGMVGACALVVGGAASAAPATPTDTTTGTTTYYESGARYEFTIPANVVSMHVTAIGGRGAGDGGLGALVEADFDVKEGQTFIVHVAGDAHDYFMGGYNGGGNGVHGNVESSGGGGASDLRAGGDNPADRIIVAAGGAGAGGEGGNAGQGGGGGFCAETPGSGPGSLIAGGVGGAA